MSSDDADNADLIRKVDALLSKHRNLDAQAVTPPQQERATDPDLVSRAAEALRSDAHRTESQTSDALTPEPQIAEPKARDESKPSFNPQGKPAQRCQVFQGKRAKPPEDQGSGCGYLFDV
jgi:hypothetical protein